MPAFARDPDVTRQIGLVDLLFACAIALALFPAIVFAIGYFLRIAAYASGLGWPLMIAGILVSFGSTGFLTWAATPIALVAGWWATRTGRIGWAIAIVLGAIGGPLFSLPFFVANDARPIGSEGLTIIAIFAGLGAIYGLAGYLALRWLRADILRNVS